MNWRGWVKAAGLVAVSALLIVVILVGGLVAFVAYNAGQGRDWSVPTQQVSDSLTRTADGYAFTGDALMRPENWAMLLDETGKVVWSWRKPDDVPEMYTMTEVASFTRWYLGDYPVQCRVREDGLLVVGDQKGSIWKHQIVLDMESMLQVPFWFAGLFLLALGCVLGLAYLATRRWFRQAQRVRDEARAGWINGVSHDIRTPLTVVMGYAAQIEEDKTLPLYRQRQAGVIRAQSQVIRDLVNDLNLTMRLDCAMQALRKERVQPAAFVRRVTADFLNGGLAEGFPVQVDLPDTPLPEIEADTFLLRRAVNNLLVNCVRHNAPGCAISIGARAENDNIAIWVEGGQQASERAMPSPQLEQDGGAAHGTGLKLVAQIAAAHGGQVRFLTGASYRCELWLPVARKSSSSD